MSIVFEHATKSWRLPAVLLCNSIHFADIRTQDPLCAMFSIVLFQTDLASYATT